MGAHTLCLNGHPQGISMPNPPAQTRHLHSRSNLRRVPALTMSPQTVAGGEDGGSNARPRENMKYVNRVLQNHRQPGHPTPEKMQLAAWAHSDFGANPLLGCLTRWGLYGTVNLPMYL
eukprot:scpid100436/ scgid3783/ 